MTSIVKTAFQRVGEVRTFSKATLLSLVLLIAGSMTHQVSAQLAITVDPVIGFNAPTIDNDKQVYYATSEEGVIPIVEVNTQSPVLTPNSTEVGGIVNLTVYGNVTYLALSQNGSLVFSTADVGSTVVIDPLAAGVYTLTVIYGGTAYNLSIELTE